MIPVTGTCFIGTRTVYSFRSGCRLFCSGCFYAHRDPTRSSLGSGTRSSFSVSVFYPSVNYSHDWVLPDLLPSVSCFMCVHRNFLPWSNPGSEKWTSCVLFPS